MRVREIYARGSHVPLLKTENLHNIHNNWINSIIVLDIDEGTIIIIGHFQEFQVSLRIDILFISDSTESEKRSELFQKITSKR